MIFSFNDSKLVTVWGGFSTKWYVSLLQNQALKDAAWVTLRVGAHLGHGRDRPRHAGRDHAGPLGRFPGRTLFSGMIFAPLVMPEVITGLSLLLLFVAMGLDRGFWTITLAHITFTMCFVAVVVQSRLHDFDQSVEEAAMDLGATPVNTFFQVTLPIIAPAVVSALDAGLHAVARRSRHRELHHGPGRHDPADEDLQSGAPRRDAGDQRDLDHPDRHCDSRRPFGSLRHKASNATRRRSASGARPSELRAEDVTRDLCFGRPAR